VTTQIPASPQLVTDSRMLYFGWVPADPDAVARLVHPSLEPNGNVFMNQYVVDSPEQASHFGAYSLTYIGSDLVGQDADPNTPGRWWTHYFNSSPLVRAYASERGVPATPGETELEITDGVLTATTIVDGAPIIRTRARVGDPGDVTATGHLVYVTEIGDGLVSGRYPYVAGLVDPWEVLSLEFLEPEHPVYALRPADPLQILWGFYSPGASFCYPGGETRL
jgi:hypothetical protein